MILVASNDKDTDNTNTKRNNNFCEQNYKCTNHENTKFNYLYSEQSSSFSIALTTTLAHIT